MPVNFFNLGYRSPGGRASCHFGCLRVGCDRISLPRALPRRKIASNTPGNPENVGEGAYMPSRCCEFVDSRLRLSPPDRASAVPYGQAGKAPASVEFTGYLLDFRRVRPGATPDRRGPAHSRADFITQTAELGERCWRRWIGRIAARPHQAGHSMGEILGRVMTVAGSQVTVNPEADLGDEGLFRIGAMVKVGSGNREVVATISAVRFESNSPSKRILFADLLGEIVPSNEGPSRFRRGVTQHPISGTPVVAATDADLTTIFAPLSRSNVRIGTLHHDARQPAFVMVNELLRKHFAVLGTTGSGKSCAVSLLLSAILADYPMAHTILIDPHNEYGRVFGKTAEVINIDNLQLPFWLFDFEEAVGILVRGGTAQEQEAQTLILKDAITRARRHYAGESHAATTLSVDTPTPFRVSDLIRFIYEAMGRLDKPILRSAVRSPRNDLMRRNTAEVTLRLRG